MEEGEEEMEMEWEERKELVAEFEEFCFLRR